MAPWKRQAWETQAPASLSLTWNMLLGRFIVTPNVPEDVVKAVQFGATHGLKVAARGTGHQLAGLILPEGGITVDMRNMVGVSFDNATKLATLQVRRTWHTPQLLVAVTAAHRPHGWLWYARSTCHLPACI